MSSFLVGQSTQGMIRTYRDNIHKFIAYMQLCNITVSFSQKFVQKCVQGLWAYKSDDLPDKRNGHPFKS